MTMRHCQQITDIGLATSGNCGPDSLGGWFGTILVNLEGHKVVDLLPDRQAGTPAQWMR
jgi:hypothetical protein